MDSPGLVAVIRGNNLGLSVTLVKENKLKKTSKCVGSDAKVDFEKSYKKNNNAHKCTSTLSNRDIPPKVNYNGYINTFSHAKRGRTNALFSTNRNIYYQRTLPGSNTKAEQLFKDSLRRYSFDNKARCYEQADVIAKSKLKKLINANRPSPYAKVNIRTYRAKIRQYKLLHLLKNYNFTTGAQNDHLRSQNKRSERKYSDKTPDQLNDELSYSYDYFNVGKKNRLRKMQVYLSDDVGNTIKTNDGSKTDKLIMCPALNKRYCKHLQLYHNKRTCAKHLCKAACQDPEPKNLLYKIAMNICCKCQKKLPCDCFPAKKTNKNFNTIIEDRVSEWADDVPVYMNESPEGKIKRRLLIHKLKETLKKLPKDYQFLELARSEIKEVVKNMPMWRPNGAQDRDNLMNNLTTALVEKLVNLNAGLVGKIESVFNDVSFKDTDTQGRYIKKKKEIENPVHQIKVLIEEDCNDEKFKDKLQSNLHGILNELPLDLSKEDIDEEKALEKITSKVANELNNIALEYKETKLADTMDKLRVQGSEVWVNPEEDSLNSYIFEERIIWDVIEKTPALAQISKTHINDMVKKLADQLHPLGLDAKDKKSLTARVNSFLEKICNKTQTQIKATDKNYFVENILQELEFKIPNLTPLSVEQLIWDVIEKTPELASVSKTNLRNHVNLLAFTVNGINLEDTDSESEAKNAISLFLDSLSKKSVIQLTEETTEKIANDLLNAIKIHKPKLDIPDDELRIWDAIENIPEFADVRKSKIENMINTLSKKIRILYNNDADEVEFKQILRPVVDNLLENTQWEKDDQKKELLTQTIYNGVARPKGAVEEHILWEALKELPGSSKINKSNMDSLIKEIAIDIHGITKKVDGNGSSNTELQDRVSNYLQVISMKIGRKIDDEEKNKFIQTVCNKTKAASVHKEEERLIWTSIKKIPEFNDIPRHEIRDMVKSLAIKLHGYTKGIPNLDQTDRIESFLNKISTKYNQPLNSYTKNKFTKKIIRHSKISAEEQRIWDIIENTPDLATIPRSDISPMVKQVTNEIQKIKSDEDSEDIQAEIQKRISNFFKILLHKYDLKSSIIREKKLLRDKIDKAPELTEIHKDDIKKPVQMLDNNIKRTDDEELGDIENEKNTVFHEVATKSANTLDSKKVHKFSKDFTSQLVQQNKDMNESMKQRLDTSIASLNKTSIRVKDENGIVRLNNNINVEKQKYIEAEVALSIFKQNPKFSNIPENTLKDIIKKHIGQYYYSKASDVIENLLQNIATTTGCDIDSQETEDFINTFSTKFYDKMLVIKKENIVFDKLKDAFGEINHMEPQDEIKEIMAVLHLLDEKEITKDIELEKINVVQKIIRLYSDKSGHIIDHKLLNKLTQKILNDIHLLSPSMRKEEMIWDVINSTPELKDISKDKIIEIVVTLSKLLPDIHVDGADCELTSEVQDRIGCLLRDIARITDTKINSHIKIKVANTYIQTAVNQARVVANTELLWNIIKSMPQLASIVETEIKDLVKKLALDISNANVTKFKKHELVNDFIKNVFIKTSINFDGKLQKELSEHFINKLQTISEALENEIIIWDILNNTSGLDNIKNDEVRDAIRKLASELPDKEGTTEDLMQVVRDLLTEVSTKAVIKLNSEQREKIAKEFATKKHEYTFKSDENSLLESTDKSNNTYKFNGSELSNPYKIQENASNVSEEKI
ncbi:hypothetical protein JYU34_000917 [Plutella xylostella]|uniref:Uncharacterized protein n=1 Tax=Plutella xylostella TaxID=51655 RepID=A0ABQ7R5N5_PLUXY|nr:hypothetical protein JYU34_000917 [Plutella xylostella]